MRYLPVAGDTGRVMIGRMESMGSRPHEAVLNNDAGCPEIQ
jgi:hypothetical protein